MARSAGTVLCLVPTRVLLEQWHAEISNFYPGPIGVLGDGHFQVEAVTVSTYETAYRRSMHLGDRFRLLIVDEIHHFGSGARDEILEMSIAPFRLGLTATMPTAPETLERMEELIGPTLFELGISDLSGHFLSEFELLSLKLPLAPDERARYQMEISAFHRFLQRFDQERGGGNWVDLVRFASRSPEGRQALAAFRRSKELISWTRAKQETLTCLYRQHQGSRILIFTPIGFPRSI
jgi:superfamily II DNA or RNA helicase